MSNASKEETSNLQIRIRSTIPADRRGELHGTQAVEVEGAGNHRDSREAGISRDTGAAACDERAGSVLFDDVFVWKSGPRCCGDSQAAEKENLEYGEDPNG
jgi:hypothetical protein